MNTRIIFNPWIIILIVALLFTLLGSVGDAGAADLDEPLPASETPTPSMEPLPALQEPSAPTATEEASNPTYPRPLVVLESYSLGSYAVRPGQDFNLQFRLRNGGQDKAKNVKVTLTAGDFIPRGNGGVLYAGTIAPGASTGYTQPLTASPGLQEETIGALTLQIGYSDEAGTSYSETFTLGIRIGSKPKNTPAPVYYATPTPTPTTAPRPQLIIRDYNTDIPELKPGARFTLSMELGNAGGSEAKRITMIMGGGTRTGGNDTGKTPSENDSGGLSGAGGDFSSFAPIGSSNVKFIGDLTDGKFLIATQELIVNGGTKPGAYPIKFSFVYNDDKGASFTDDQVVTLLVVLPPMLDISFYRPPDPLLVGQPASLPIQIVNLDRNSIILSRMEVTADDAHLENASALIGYLDPGGYFTLDPMIYPEVPGLLTVTVKVDYLDDFSQMQSILKQFELEVAEAPVIEPPPEDAPGTDAPPPASGEETFLQKALRFARGLIGLDSGRSGTGGEITPPVEFPPSEGEPPTIQIEPVG
jgi:hypothetical protein